MYGTYTRLIFKDDHIRSEHGYIYVTVLNA